MKPTCLTCGKKLASPSSDCDCGKPKWDAMSDQEKIEWLCVRIMGWEIKESPQCAVRIVFANGENIGSIKRGLFEPTFKWNPLADWNHAAEIVRKMRERWGYKYILKSVSNGYTQMEFIGHLGTLDGWARERNENIAVCKAAFLALR